MSKLPFVLVLVTLASCNAIKVYTNYNFDDRSKKYKSFNFTVESGELDIDEYNRNLLRIRVTKELESRGYFQSETPDFWVDMNVETFVRINPVTYSNRYGAVESKVYTAPAGKLYIDLLDSSKEHILWEAVASAKVDRTYKNSLLIVKGVRKIFKRFPD